MLEYLKGRMNSKKTPMRDVCLEATGAEEDVRDLVLASIAAGAEADPEKAQMIVDAEIEDANLDKILDKIPEAELDDEISEKELEAIEESFIPEWDI